jgi:hypothetical protein
LYKWEHLKSQDSEPAVSWILDSPCEKRSLEHFRALLVIGALSLQAAIAESVDPSAALDACPGYTATNVITHGARLTADLILAGKACDVFGTDIEKLGLEVVYETSKPISPVKQKKQKKTNQSLIDTCRYANTLENH